MINYLPQKYAIDADNTLGNVTPYDVYTGRHLEIIQRRKEVKSRTLEAKKDDNRTARKERSDP